MYKETTKRQRAINSKAVPWRFFGAKGTIPLATNIIGIINAFPK